ncbi:MAG: hypothetical protein E7562_02185 [Ruminococcaceae bacterium]|nr:hypothetical protein [Oscillospiraceae bacterium]
MLKKTVALVLSFCMLFMLYGCSSEKSTSSYDINSPVKTHPTGVVASNEKFELIWDSSNYSVKLKSLVNGKIWSNIPDGYTGTSSAVQSTININIMNTNSMKQDMVRGYSETAAKGRVSCEQIKNGVKVTYYFDNYLISVPVEYVLREDSIAVSIRTKEVVEGGEYVVLSVNLAPYMCSCENVDTSAYLFVPTGSGALMNVAENADSTRKYSGAVYGEDASRIQPEITIDPEQIYMPCYGVATSNGNALFAIIENAAETAVIEAEAGNSRTDYSCVSSTFYLRGYDSFATTQWIWSYQDLNYVSDDRADNVITVGYYPLYDDMADYNGMAKCYRDYLLKNGGLSKSDVSQTPYSLTFVGGALKTVATGGIPHNVTSVLTSFSSAQKIIDDITNRSGVKPSVQLIGYGNNGIDVGKIAGGYDFIGDFGSKDSRESLEKYCKNNGIDLYTDFDLIRYTESGGGFSYLSDAAKSATLHIAESYLINTPLRDYDKSTVYRFIKKSEIKNATKKLIEFIDDEDVSGVSISSLSNVSYSDFTSIKYGVKGESESIAKNSINSLKKSKHSVAVSAANQYAACVADTVYNSPLTNGDYDVFDEWIPFYQMVFKGSKPIYSSYINLQPDRKMALLSALAGGNGLGFAICDSYDIDLSVSKTFPLYGTVYTDNKQFIVESLENYADYYEAVKNAKIDRFEILSSGVSRTVFDNGVSILVNRTEQSFLSELGELAANSAAWYKN